MSCLVPHDASELVTRSAFDIEHLTSLQPNETWMREVEWDREARNTKRGEPFLREPDVGAKTKAPPLERLVQRVDARLEPGPFYSKPKVLDAKLKQSLVGPGGPGESSFHGRCEYAAGPQVARWPMWARLFRVSDLAAHLTGPHFHEMRAAHLVVLLLIPALTEAQVSIDAKTASKMIDGCVAHSTAK